jgi:integrase
VSRKLRRAACCRVGPREHDGHTSSWTLTPAEPVTLSERAQAGSGPSDQDLRAVADIYQLAYLTHAAPTKVVMGRFNPSRIRNAAQVLGQILDAAVAGRLHRNPARGLRRPRHRRARDDDPVRGRAGAARLPDRGPLRDAGALHRLDGVTDRGGGRPSGRSAGRARPPGRRGRGGDRGERPTRVGADQDRERRTVPLPHFLAEQLGAYLADRPHDPDDLVFTMLQGGPLRASKWGERYFRPAAASAGLPEASASTISGTPRRHWRSGRTPR